MKVHEGNCDCFMVMITLNLSRTRYSDQDSNPIPPQCIGALNAGH